MANLTEAQDAYDRHNLHVGVIHSATADVILTLEAEIAHLRTDLDGCGAALAEAQRALEAERAARMAATLRWAALEDAATELDSGGDTAAIHAILVRAMKGDR